MAVQSGSSQTFLPAYQEKYLKDLLAGASALGTKEEWTFQNIK